MARRTRTLAKVHSGYVRRPASRKVVSEDQNTISWVPDGFKQAHVTLFIDLDELLTDLGRRAIHNANGKASLAGGAIQVKVTGAIAHHREG